MKRGVCPSAWFRLAVGADWREMGVSAQHHPAEAPFSAKKGGNSLFSKAKEHTIADCWDKMEIPT
jgi:hypothetical protein